MQYSPLSSSFSLLLFPTLTASALAVVVVVVVVVVVIGDFGLGGIDITRAIIEFISIMLNTS